MSIIDIVKKNRENEAEMRERWFNYLTLEYYYGYLNVAKRHDAKAFADFWLSELRKIRLSDLEALKEGWSEIAKKVSHIHFPDATKGDYCNGFESGKELVLGEISSTLSTLQSSIDEIKKLT